MKLRKFAAWFVVYYVAFAVLVSLATLYLHGLAGFERDWVLGMAIWGVGTSATGAFDEVFPP